MKAALKKVIATNFKNNSDLKVQYIFDSGYCFFKKSRAEEHAATYGGKYHTVQRDAEAEADQADKARQLEQLKTDLETNRSLLLDATEAKDKAELEARIEELETQIKELED
ncbi:MAG: hypothetical protein N4A74_21480 [Carboxylicivirga sp.]|jgi:protein subunit release factor A|nr:hypothetical protein [Carboxylicivirga sp.]